MVVSLSKNLSGIENSWRYSSVSGSLRYMRSMTHRTAVPGIADDFSKMTSEAMGDSKLTIRLEVNRMPSGSVVAHVCA
jgi:hypothetical protein